MKSIKNIVLGCCLLAAPFGLESKVVTSIQAQTNVKNAIAALKMNSNDAKAAQDLLNNYAAISKDAKAKTDAMLKSELGKDIAGVKQIIIKAKTPVLVKGGATDADAKIEAAIQSDIEEATSVLNEYATAQSINAETDNGLLNEYSQDLITVKGLINNQKTAAAKISDASSRASFVKQLDETVAKVDSQMNLVQDRIKALQKPVVADLTLEEIKADLDTMTPDERAALLKDLGIEPTKEEAEAATKIQKLWRGKKTRNDLKKAEEKAKQEAQAANTPPAAALPVPTAPMDESAAFNEIKASVGDLQSNIRKQLDAVTKATGANQAMIKQDAAEAANRFAGELAELKERIGRLTLKGARDTLTDLFNKAEDTLKQLKNKLPATAAGAQPTPAAQPAPAAVEPAQAQVDAQVNQAIADLTEAEKATVRKGLEKIKGKAKIEEAKKEAAQLRSARAAIDSEADILIKKIAPILNDRNLTDIRIGSVTASIANSGLDRNKLSPAKKTELEKSIKDFEAFVATIPQQHNKRQQLNQPQRQCQQQHNKHTSGTRIYRLWSW